MPDERFTPLDYTKNAEEAFYDAVDNPDFRSDDLTLIYNALMTALKPLSFGDFLKRYVYKAAKMSEPFETVPVSLYADIIVDAFRDTQTPASFTPSTTTLKAAVKNWLTRQTVSRQAVLLLGFGLSMDVNEVNDFLTKALHEHRLSPKNPTEVICRYCYEHQYGFAKFEMLMKQFQENTLTVDILPEELDSSVKLDGIVSGMTSERTILTYLAQLKASGKIGTQGTLARELFNRLYHRAQEITAQHLNDMAAVDMEISTDRLRDELSRDDRFYKYQKDNQIQRVMNGGRKWQAVDIGPGDIENVICSAIPVGENGNYLPMKFSSLYNQFDGRRFNKKHMGDVLAGKADVTRFDLITLNFYVYALGPHLEDKPIKRYQSFIDSTDTYLRSSGMGALYVANPYECFVLMCLLADDPIGTYADVWELSFKAEELKL